MNYATLVTSYSRELSVTNFEAPAVTIFLVQDRFYLHPKLPMTGVPECLSLRDMILPHLCAQDPEFMVCEVASVFGSQNVVTVNCTNV
jgi:hypothetical protein